MAGSINDLEHSKFEESGADGLVSSRIINIEHSVINNGASFQVGDIFYAIPDDGVAEGLFQIANEMHVVLEVVSVGDCELRIFENPEFSNAGTAMTIFNKNRTSIKTSGNTVTHTPTLTDDGTELTPTFIAGGSGGTATSAQTLGFAGELILKAGNDYLFRIINKSGQARTIGAKLEWYEPALATREPS